jgi:hypothetical protein
MPFSPIENSPYSDDHQNLNYQVYQIYDDNLQNAECSTVSQDADKNSRLIIEPTVVDDFFHSITLPSFDENFFARALHAELTQSLSEETPPSSPASKHAMLISTDNLSKLEEAQDLQRPPQQQVQTEASALPTRSNENKPPQRRMAKRTKFNQTQVSFVFVNLM